MSHMKSNVKCYTQLTDGLYLGNQFSTSIITDVNVIVSIGCKCKSTISSIINYKVSVKDHLDSDLTPLFNDVTEFIYANLSSNKKVLVHCQAGMNRSPIFAIAYLARYIMTLEEAVLHVTTQRSIVRIQPHYLHQLKKWLSEQHINNCNYN